METATTQATIAAVIESALNPAQEDVRMTTDVNVNHDAADDNTDAPTVDAGPEAQPEVDPVAAARILQLCNSAITSYFYMSNPKRVAALESALAIPVSDDKSFQQFYTHAEKGLLADAYRDARKIGGTPTEVTTALIMAEAHERYFAKHQKRAVVNEEYEG